MQESWQFEGPFHGFELESNGTARIATDPGIYIWRRGASPDPQAARLPSLFTSWVRNLTDTPLAVIQRLEAYADSASREVRIRPEFVQIRELRVGGGHMTAGKIQLLNDHSQSTEFRTELAKLLEQSGTLFGPVLYVGEGDNIRQRTDQHIAGVTSLLPRLRDAGIGLSDLQFWYLLMPGTSKSYRQLIEQILTHFLVAPLVVRAG